MSRPHCIGCGKELKFITYMGEDLNVVCENKKCSEFMRHKDPIRGWVEAEEKMMSILKSNKESIDGLSDYINFVADIQKVMRKHNWGVVKNNKKDGV